MTPRRISRVIPTYVIPRSRDGSVRASTLGTVQSTPFSRFQWAAAKLAKAHAESEFEKYRIVQDRLFESDFDRVIKQLKEVKDKETD